MEQNIVYCFHLDSGGEQRFEVKLERPASTGDLPSWTRLDTNKCPNCPLASGPEANCPAAADLAPVVERFSTLASIEKVDVRVVTGKYEVRKHTDTQTALSGLMGLILATSACPILSRMRPLAQMHMPFATTTETVYRIAAMHLVGCFLRGEPGDLAGLEKFFADLERVNLAFARRLKRAIQRDAGINALVMLHSRAVLASLSIESELEHIRAWYERPSQI